MKKLLYIFSLSLLFFGCTKKVDSNSATNKTNVSSIKNQMADYDLTSMNYNMANGVLFDILITPEKYVNKTIIIKGQFNSQIYEGRRYYTAVIWDSTGCCPAGLDFIPPENMIFPDDFPADNEYITVYGIMQIQEIDGEEQLCFMAESIDFNKS